MTPLSAIAPSPPRIAIAAFGDWTDHIRANLEGHWAADFVDLERIDLDAYDVIIPLARSHAEILSRRPDLKGRKFLHPAPATIALCHDKLALARFLITEGFGDLVPPLRSPGPPYPYVWKRRHGAFGRDCRVVRGPAEENGLDLADPEWFAQTLAPQTTEYAVHVLRAGGRIRYLSTMTYVMASPGLVLGEFNRAQTRRLNRGSAHEAVFGAILDRLGYEGVACIDFKVADDGRPQIFEINPRFGGSLAFDAAAFVDAYIAALEPRGR